MVDLPFGRAWFHDGLPAHRDLNAVAVDGAPPPEFLDVVEEVQAELPHRHVMLPVAVPTPPGWESDRFAHLRWAAPLPPMPSGVEEVDRAELRALREQWLREEGLDHVLDTILAGDDVLFGVTPTRALCVRGRDGAPASMALVVDTGPMQMVEDVYTTPGRRGEGLGAAVVTAAVATAFAAGAELVHIPTDATGRARVLYERLGFELAGLTYRLVRPPG